MEKGDPEAKNKIGFFFLKIHFFLKFRDPAQMSSTLAAIDLLRLIVEKDHTYPTASIECRLPGNAQAFRARFGPGSDWMVEDELTLSRHPNPMKWAMYVRDEHLERQGSSHGISVKPYIFYKGKNLRDWENELRHSNNPRIRTLYKARRGFDKRQILRKISSQFK